MKFSKKYRLSQAIYHFFIGIVVFVTIFFTLQPEEEEVIVFTTEMFIIASIITGLYYLVAAIYIILAYKFISYEFKEDCIELKKGIFFKKHQIIRYDKINAIDTKRTLISLLLGTAVLNIDSGSTVSQEAEISIFHDVKVIEELEKKLKCMINNETYETVGEELKTNNGYTYTFKNKFVSMCLSVGLWFGMFITFISLSVVGAFTLETFIVSEFLKIIVGMLLLTIMLIICSILIGMISKVFHYYKYSIKRENNNLIIEFGLFNKIKHTLGYEKIKGVTIKQNLLQRLFKYATIELEVIGFGMNSGDENSSQIFNGVFIPLCKASEINNIFKLYLPEYTYKNLIYKSSTKTFKFYITIPIIIVSIILVPFLVLALFNYYFLISLIIYVIILLLIMIVSLFKLKCQGIDFDDKLVYISNGIFTKKILLINRNSLIGLGKKTTHIREKNNILSIYVDYYNTAFKNREEIAMLEKDVYEKISNIF